MTRFMRVIHVFGGIFQIKDVDGPDKPGHDEEEKWGASFVRLHTFLFGVPYFVPNFVR